MMVPTSIGTCGGVESCDNGRSLAAFYTRDVFVTEAAFDSPSLSRNPGHKTFQDHGLVSLNSNSCMVAQHDDH